VRDLEAELVRLQEENDAHVETSHENVHLGMKDREPAFS
jgi:hypothetical protein